jgi:hypothetical protein
MSYFGYEQKLAALNALSDCCLIMRKPGNWYVQQSVEVKKGKFLEGRYGNGCTPEEAILNHWERLTKLAPGEYLVTRATVLDKRQAHKWNGFMWEQVVEENLPIL